MAIVATLQRHVAKIIQADPLSVTMLRRVTVSLPAGGQRTQEITLPPQTVRLYSKQDSRQITQPQSLGPVSGWGLLAGADSDIRPGDQFDALSRRFRVVATYPNTLRGEVICIAADIEEVGADAGG